MLTPFITLKNVCKSFPAKEGHRKLSVLHGVNMTIHKGEFVVLLGPSGCGKSTLLRMICQLEKSTRGEILYHEPFSLEKIGFVFQNFGLLPWLSVKDNVALGLIGRNVQEPERGKRVDAILSRFGLGEFGEHFPRDLSGGMKQRVGLARAFVTNPEIIFLDEPFSELDFFTAKDLRQMLVDMWRKHGVTIVMVSHYIDEAVELADRIAVFTDRPGTITEIIKNDLPRPRNHREERFFAKEDEVLGHFGKA